MSPISQNWVLLVKYGAVGLLGITVLIPAFLLLMHFAVLSNVAGSGAGRTHVATLLEIVTFAGGITHLIALGKIVFKHRNMCRWCHYYCIAYAIYVSAMMGYLSLGNFLRKLETSGLLYALSSHIQSVAYMLIALLFAAAVFLLISQHNLKG